MSHLLLWFGNDLRLHDHPILQKKAHRLLPLYILDPRLFKPLELGFPKTGSYRLQFLLESLEVLKDNLKSMGSDLVFKIGYPEDMIPTLVRTHAITEIWTQEEVTPEEKWLHSTVASKIEVPINTYQGKSLLHPDDLPFEISQLPRVFTDFRKAVEKNGAYRPPLPSPVFLPPCPQEPSDPWPDFAEVSLTPPSRDSRAAFALSGGETSALNHLQAYIWDRQYVTTYKDTRNGLIGADYSTKFSPFLANGSLSARRIAQEILRFETEICANSSTYWVIFELLWRDFFFFTGAKQGKRLFYARGIQSKAPETAPDLEVFHAWRRGETSDDFVNANMKELLYTGFMSNRGRQNVASYLVHHLKQDWRWGAAWFESQLIDYDVTSNWGNWMYVAGVGNDPRSRVFNTRKQARQYDPDGQYRSLWLKLET